MKKTLLLTLCCILSIAASAQTKYVGGDISLLTKYEEAGVVYKDKNGNTVQPLAFFKQEGLNAMRVRLFVDPSKDSDKGVCQDLDYVMKLGARIKATDMKLMLDFHYSDTWADPGKQWTPDAWKNLTDAQLCDKIYAYTVDCLKKMKEANAEPNFIQIGNEISFGMLWGTKATVGDNEVNRCYIGNKYNENYWARFFEFLKKASAACRAECPNAKIILHNEQVPSQDVLLDYYDRMKANEIDYDIIGLSYYPAHHKDIGTLESALNKLEAKDYRKDIMIVETGYSYKWAKEETTFDYTSTYPYSEEGQRKFTADLITMLNKHTSVTGLFWWWMEDNGNKGVTDKWWNTALYNHDTGQPWAAFYELKSFLGDPTGIETIKREPLTVNQHAWYTLDGRKLNGKPSTKGIYIQNGKKKIVR